MNIKKLLLTLTGASALTGCATVMESIPDYRIWSMAKTLHLYDKNNDGRFDKLEAYSINDLMYSAKDNDFDGKWDELFQEKKGRQRITVLKIGNARKGILEALNVFNTAKTEVHYYDYNGDGVFDFGLIKNECMDLSESCLAEFNKNVRELEERIRKDLEAVKLYR